MESPHCLVTNIQDCDIIVSSNPSHSNMFTFGLVLLGKV